MPPPFPAPLPAPPEFGGWEFGVLVDTIHALPDRSRISKASIKRRNEMHLEPTGGDKSFLRSVRISPD